MNMVVKGEGKQGGKDGEDEEEEGDGKNAM